MVGIDRDPEALRRAGERLAPYGDRFTGVHATYDEIPDILAGLGLAQADAVLFDLGVSSMQLDVAERGFAYREDAPLDMRMDPTTGPTAADVLNTYTHGELARVLREYGEEKFASRIAAAVVRERQVEPFSGSARLVALLYDAIPAPARRTGGHPAKRTFQALRMEVNDELGVLRRAIPAAIDVLAVGGRVVVESYQSLEDRLVKQAFAAATRVDVPDRTCRSSLPTASPPCVWSPAAPSGPIPTRSPTTHVPPRSGCALSNGSAPAREQHDHPTTPCQQGASRRGRTAAGAPHEQHRARPPYPGPAPGRRRPRAGPPHRGPAPPPAPQQPGALRDGDLDGRRRGRRRAPPLQHLDAAGVLRRHDLQHRADTLLAQQQTLQMELDKLRDPQSIALKAQRMGMVLPTSPAVLDLRTGKVLGDPGTRHGDRPPPAAPPPPPKPAVARPKPRVVVVPATTRQAHPAAGFAGPHRPRLTRQRRRAQVDKAPPAATADAPSPPVTEQSRNRSRAFPEPPRRTTAPAARRRPRPAPGAGTAPGAVVRRAARPS